MLFPSTAFNFKLPKSILGNVLTLTALKSAYGPGSVLLAKQLVPHDEQK